MARAKTKTMTVDAIKHVTEKGVIETWACKDPNRPGNVKGIERENALTLEMHYCTAFLSENEAYQVVLSLCNAGKIQFGEQFLNRVQVMVESMSEPD